MNSMHEQIEKVTNLFLQFGIKSISMDDIASELGISKKKLYQTYTDKTELVEKTITLIKLKIKEIVDEYSKLNMNAIEKEIYHRKKYLKTYLSIKPTFLFDLRKFYPSIFDDFISFKKLQTVKSCNNLIIEGKKQGLYREDLDPEFISKLSITLISSFIHPDLNEISENDLMSKAFSDQFFIYHMNGICTEKGRKIFNDLLKAELL
ncbi:TetR/AcrR family transcriptional regulator [Labilibacter sediminis]|nr:TetR/AcrR family transcriptional regulator [Labilibacter sediminis]